MAVIAWRIVVGAVVMSLAISAGVLGWSVWLACQPWGRRVEGRGQVWRYDRAEPEWEVERWYHRQSWRGQRRRRRAG